MTPVTGPQPAQSSDGRGMSRGGGPYARKGGPRLRAAEAFAETEQVGCILGSRGLAGLRKMTQREATMLASAQHFTSL